MNVTDLDEADGLTADMVRAWLKARGCVQTPGHWDHPTKQPIRYKDGDYGGPLWDGTLSQIAYDFGLTIQQLLRDMNPRLGLWPSPEEIAAHDGPWLCLCLEDETACMGVFDGDWFKHSGNHVIEKRDRWARFWPCDAHGNKVRWPKVAS